MMTSVKKPKTLADFPLYEAESAKLEKFRRKLAETVEQLRSNPARLTSRQVANESAVATLLNDGEPQPPSQAALETQRRHLTAAIAAQQRRMENELRTAAYSIADDHRPEHNRLKGAIVDAVVRLVESFQAEQRFVDGLDQRGIPVRDYLGTVNFSQASQMPRAIKTVTLENFQRDNNGRVHR